MQWWWSFAVLVVASLFFSFMVVHSICLSSFVKTRTTTIIRTTTRRRSATFIIGWNPQVTVHKAVVPFFSSSLRCRTRHTVQGPLPRLFAISSVSPSTTTTMTESSSDYHLSAPPQKEQSHAQHRRVVVGAATAAAARRVGLSHVLECGQRLRQGDLVAFPTETVYGLGANALDEEACHKIFQAKERPLTDPLIVHVPRPELAYPLWAATAATTRVTRATTSTPTTQLSVEGQILHSLCRTFWPGPLSIVATAAPDGVPAVVMAGTGMVACRSPAHTVARVLLEAAHVPIAAPSANKFGHVSPTTAQHVWDDLQYENVWILEEDQQENDSNNHHDSDNHHDKQQDHEQNATDHQQVGVESSVVKLEMLPLDETNKGTLTTMARLTILRQGAISRQQLQACLQEANLQDTESSLSSSSSSSSSVVVEVITQSKAMVSKHVATVSPGQTIRHYAPNLPSFLLSEQCSRRHCHHPRQSESKLTLSSSTTPWTPSELEQARLQESVLLDYGQQLQQWQPWVLAYRDLTPQNSSIEAAQEIYNALRWAEQVPGAVRILFATPLPQRTPTTTTLENGGKTEGTSNGEDETTTASIKPREGREGDTEEEDALALAVKDRLTRAASGKVIDGLEQAIVL